jgi:hypothetical protein
VASLGQPASSEGPRVARALGTPEGNDMTSRFSTNVTGGALIVAPCVLLMTTVLYSTGGSGMNNSDVAGAVQVWAMIAFAVGLLGLVRRLEPSAPRGATLLGVLVVVGCAGGVGFGIDSMHAALPGGSNLLDADSSAFAPLGLAIPGALFPAALAATGIALWRAGLISGLVALPVVVGAVLFPASRFPSIEALAIVADLVLVVGFVALGAAQLTGREQGVARTPVPTTP